MILLGERVGQALDDHGAGATAEDGPSGRRIERPAVPVAGPHPTRLPQVPVSEREFDVRAADNGHVAVTDPQRLTGQVQCDEGARARGQHRDAGPPQIELVRDGRGHVVPVAQCHHAGDDGAGERRVRQQMLLGITRRTRGSVDAYPVAEGRRIVARVLQGRVRDLQEQPGLRVTQLRLTRGHPEQLGVEILGLGHHRGRLDVRRVGQQLFGHTVPAQLLVAQRTDGLPAVHEIRPVFVDVSRPGDLGGKSDDCDGLVRIQHCSLSWAASGRPGQNCWSTGARKRHRGAVHAVHARPTRDATGGDVPLSRRRNRLPADGLSGLACGTGCGPRVTGAPRSGDAPRPRPDRRAWSGSARPG